MRRIRPSICILHSRILFRGSAPFPPSACHIETILCWIQRASRASYISNLSPIFLFLLFALLNIQIRKNDGLAENEEGRGTWKGEKDGTTDRRSRGDHADKMNSRTATCRSANIARIHRSSMNISRFWRLPRFRFVSLFSENGLSGLGHRRIPFALLSFSLMELSLASCYACERLLFQWLEIREIAKLEDVIDLFGINRSEKKENYSRN